VLVWLIFIFYLLAAASSVVQVASTLASAEQRLDARGQPYTVFDYVESLAFVGLKVAAAVMLFRLSRMAFTLFLAVLALNVVATGYDLLTKGLPPPGGPLMLTSIVIGFGIMTAICVYAWRLQTKGVLK
jgi:multisubunit Na+/H+ antiporter MnhC subunit